MAYVKLDGAPPERLLCLTFTKAAAAEMANRLHAQLALWTMLDDTSLLQALIRLKGSAKEKDLDPARRLFAQVLDTPGGLKLQCEGHEVLYRNIWIKELNLTAADTDFEE